VTRVNDVPHDSTLPELYDLLQAAIGWTDSHLHQFVTDKTATGFRMRTTAGCNSTTRPSTT
jgi:hypothetical protein